MILDSFDFAENFTEYIESTVYIVYMMLYNDGLTGTNHGRRLLFFCEGGLPSALTFGLLILRPPPRPLLSHTFYE